MKRILIFIIPLLTLYACPDRILNLPGPSEISGMGPIYINPDDESLIISLPPEEFGNLGSIIEKGDYIYICELYKGVHVIDNTDPNNPTNIRFWAIPGVSVFTISDNLLLADNSIHLWIIDISNINDIEVVDKEEDVFKDLQSRIVRRPPDDYHGYFECTNSDSGAVVGWEEKILNTPLCQAY